MPRSRISSRLRAAALAGSAGLALAGCAAPGGEGSGGPGLGLAFDTVEAPSAFAAEGLARRPERDAPGGYWAVVPGLPRAESGVVRRQGSARTVTVALFRAPRGQPPGQIVLSEAAAAVLDIGAEPVAVRVTAVREEAALVFTANRF